MVVKLLSPRWILIHIGVASLIFLMLNLGLWQLQRLDDKKAFNAILRNHTTMPVEEISRVLQSSNIAASEWRRVQLTGSYVQAKTVTVINRSQNGTAGYDVVVPFVTTNNDTYFVNRGFMQLSMSLPDTPSTETTVIGYLRTSQTRRTFGAIDSTDSDITEFQRFDIPLIAQSRGIVTQPLFIQLVKELPSTNKPWPAAVELPVINEGTHLSYAIQWFFFCLVALTAWVVVVRRKLSQVSASVQEQTSA